MATKDQLLKTEKRVGRFRSSLADGAVSIVNITGGLPASKKFEAAGYYEPASGGRSTGREPKSRKHLLSPCKVICLD